MPGSDRSAGHLLAVTLPCSRESFIERARTGPRHGVVDQLLRHDWRGLLLEQGLDACAERYATSVAQINQAVEAATAAGFEIVLEPRVEQCVGWSMGDNVVVIVAHAHGQQIEFADQLATLEQLLAAPAPDFGGVIHLVGCETAAAGDRLKLAHPRMRVLHGQLRTPLNQQLFLLRATLDYMRRFDEPYEAAAMQLRTEWARRRSK